MEINELKFDENGLIPAVIQDIESGDVLMVAYMNKESVRKTLETKKTHFWSRSRKAFWLKGETSGNFQHVKAVYYDCDLDTLLIKVDQIGVACHTGERSCFYRTLYEEGKSEHKPQILEEVYQIIDDRRRNPKEGSYTTSLMKKGRERILEKVIEEANEIREDSLKDNRQGIICETADLFYHLLVLLNYHGIDIQEVYAELQSRRRIKGEK